VFVAIIATGVRTADRPSQHLQLAPSYLARRANMMCVIHVLWELIEDSRNTAGTMPSKRNDWMKDIMSGSTLRIS
jgi:hypothetical protein